MEDQSLQFYKDLIRGKSNGPISSLLRSLLHGISIPYEGVIRLRNTLYDRHLKKINTVDRPVLGIGNITMGGTGKTPFTIWLAQELLSSGYHPGIISRGYRAKEISESLSDEVKESLYGPYLIRNDEGREIQERLPEVPHFCGSKRILAAQALLKYAPETDVLLLDDAFQHRSMARDLDIVLLDALDPFGCGHLFPRGLLREPLSGLKRAGLILLSRADLVSEEQRREIREQIRIRAPHALWGEVAHRFQRVFSGKTPVDSFENWKKEWGKNERLIAFCGLGNPEGFLKALKKEDIVPLKFVSLGDHHIYTENDQQEFAKLARTLHADGFVTTLKDQVKLPTSTLDGLPIFALETGIVPISDLSPLIGKVKAVVESKPLPL